jgi:hypothetical protein
MIPALEAARAVFCQGAFEMPDAVVNLFVALSGLWVLTVALEAPLALPRSFVDLTSSDLWSTDFPSLGHLEAVVAPRAGHSFGFC